MTREYGDPAEPLQALEADQVVPEVPVRVRDHGGTPAEDRVPAQHHPTTVHLGPEGHRVGGMPRCGEELEIQPVQYPPLLDAVPDLDAAE